MSLLIVCQQLSQLSRDTTHFAIGYFFLSSFQAIAEHIPNLDQLRLLIGNVTNRQTVEQLAEGYHHLATAQRAVRRERMVSTQGPPHPRPDRRGYRRQLQFVAGRRHPQYRT